MLPRPLLLARDPDNEFKIMNSNACLTERVGDALPEPHDSLWMQILECVWDLILTVLPLLFLVLSCAAIITDGRQAVEPGRTIQSLEQFGPTLFPIVFGAVTGRFINFLALWKASRGTKLGILEQLVGSRTLFLAFERSFLVRTRSFYTLAVPLLWTLSPLGGQSSLRVLSQTEVAINSPTIVTYYNDTYWSGNVYNSVSVVTASRLAENIYVACLLQSNATRHSSLDNWGNVKIPRLKSLKAYSPDRPTDQWIEASLMEDVTYSSLVGLMLDVPNQAIGTTMRFPVETTYLDLDCTSKFSTNSYTELEEHLGPLFVGFNTSRTPKSSASQTPLFYLGEGDYDSMGFNHFVLGVPNRSPAAAMFPEQVLLKYAAKTLDPNNGNLFFAYECAMTMPRVEAEVFCDGLLPCYVSRMRTSQRFNVSINTTPFNDRQAAGNIVGRTALSNLLGHFLWASGLASMIERTTSEWYILTGQTNLGGIGDGVEYATLTNEQLSSRLSVLLTTLWKIGVAGKHIYTQKVAEPSGCTTNWSYQCKQSGYWPAQAEASVLRSVKTWRANRVWIGITMVVSIIALIFGILGLLLKRIVDVPDILGYVSTMTRDNPHFRGPGGGERLDGIERARLIRSKDLRLMVVSDTGNNVGHMALASDERSGKYELINSVQTVQLNRGSDRSSEVFALRVQDRPNLEVLRTTES